MRIGLLCSDTLNEFRQKTLIPILDDKQFKVKVALVDKRPKPTIRQKIIKNLKRGRGGYIIIMAIKKLFFNQDREMEVNEFCRRHNIEVLDIPEPYADSTIEKIKALSLDILILMGGYGIIKKKLLKVTPRGVLSYHHGDMRKYRGMPPGLWELYNNEEEMGITVQILNPGLDSGTPILEKKIHIQKFDRPSTLRQRALKESVGMLHEALLKLADEDFVPQKIKNFGRVYTLPNLRQWIILNFKLWRRWLS